MFDASPRPRVYPNSTLSARLGISFRSRKQSGRCLHPATSAQSRRRRDKQTHSNCPRRRIQDRGSNVKHRPLRNRLALWTAFLLTIELVIFGLASGHVIYQEQLDAFREIRGQSSSPIVIRKEAAELIVALARSYLTALPVAVLFAALGVWWITRKALQHLQDVADAAERIHAKALSQRLPQPPIHDEIGRLVHVLNDTFDRLERSFAQATRFSSDASHELKTPLTIMRGEIEAALSSDSADPQMGKLLESLLQLTHHLSAIVENLLLLSC